MDDLVYLRDEKVEGIGPWIWPIADSGAWIGPSQEFASIRDHILPFAKNRQVIVTAGGCCGMYPRLWVEIFPTVYTFEPAPLNWFCLEKNCPDPRIIKYNAALGDTEQDVWLSITDPRNVGTNSIHADIEATIKVRQMTLDSLNLAGCDVLQLDIEGYEPSALLGAAETIARYRPVICLESKNPNDMSHLLLSGWGYRPIPGGPPNETVFLPI